MKTNPYILDFEPHFIKGNNTSNNKFEDLIQKSISLTFMNLSNDIDLNIMQTPLINKCDTVRNELGAILESYGVSVKYIETQDMLGDDVLGHSLLLAKGPDSIYLIDPTYSQFFLKDKCSNDEYMIYKDMVVKSPDPGFYYLNNKNKLNIAKTILENGYIELTEETSKVYADSFFTTKRGREALLNLKNPPNISGNIYMKLFLKDYNKNANKSR